MIADIRYKAFGDKVIFNNFKLVIPEGEYFVLGDNRHESKDSMYYGTFEKDEIIGTVEHSLERGKGKFSFFVDYIWRGKIFSTIANCF